ncbi:hypothetical protein ACLKA6_015456 [Drosophila palustris]
MMVSVVVSDTANECLEIHKPKHAELEALSPTTPAAEIPKNIKCYAQCLLRDYIGKDNKLSLQQIGDKADLQEKVILEHCLAVYDGMSTFAPCDYGYLILQCLTLKIEQKKSQLLQ